MENWLCIVKRDSLILFPNCSIKEIIKMIIHENWVVVIFVTEETKRLNLLEMTANYIV